MKRRVLFLGIIIGFALNANAQFTLWGIAHSVYTAPGIVQHNPGVIISRGVNSDNGVIFSYDVDSGLYTVRHNFGDSANDGIVPKFLLKSSGGKLFGTVGQITDTSANGNMLFTLDPATGVYENCLGLDSVGNYIYANLVLSSNSNIYGMAYPGGTNIINNSAGIIFSTDTSLNNCQTVLYMPDSSGYEQSSGMIEAPDGRLFGTLSAGGANGWGALFAFDPSSGIYSDLHDFNDTQPTSSFILASNNVFYGITNLFSIDSPGVVFSFDPVNNIYLNVANLNFNTGYAPDGMIQASNGKVYGITHAGGSVISPFGTIFSFDTSTHVITKLFDMIDSTGHNLVSNLIQASDGKLYGITHAGGSVISPFLASVLFSFDPATNIYTDVVNMLKDTSTGYNYSNPSVLFQAPDGKIYGMMDGGGVYGAGVIFQYDIVSKTYTKLYNFSDSLGGPPISFVEIPNSVETGLSRTNINATLFNVFPNPSGDGLFNIFIESNNNSQNYEWNISGLLGQTIISGHFVNTGSSFYEEMDLSSLLKGMYLMQLKDGQESITRKMIIQ